MSLSLAIPVIFAAVTGGAVLGYLLFARGPAARRDEYEPYDPERAPGDPLQRPDGPTRDAGGYFPW